MAHSFTALRLYLYFSSALESRPPQTTLPLTQNDRGRAGGRPAAGRGRLSGRPTRAAPAGRAAQRCVRVANVNRTPPSSGSAEREPPQRESDTEGGVHRRRQRGEKGCDDVLLYYKQCLASCRRAHPTKGVQSRTWEKLPVTRRAHAAYRPPTPVTARVSPRASFTDHHPCCKAHTARRRAPRASAASTACTRCSTWRTRSRCTNWAPATECARRSHRGGAQPYETHR